MLLEVVVELSSERHANNLAICCTRQIFTRYSIFFQEIYARSLLETHVIDELHVFWSSLFLTIHIDVVVFDLERLASYRHTTLNIILTTIHRTRNDFSYLCILFEYLLPYTINLGKGCALLLRRKRVAGFVDTERLRTRGIHKPIIVLILEVAGYGVSRRIVENHNISHLHSSQTFDTTVIPLWPFDIALTTS